MGRRKKGLDIHGWIALDKPADMTSTDAVARVRRLFNANKAGHSGTLDPLATGMLPIALGEATKTVPWLMEAEKIYRFSILWGVSTDTQDADGRAIAHSDVRPDVASAAAALTQFVGEKDQTPPIYSAVKVDGARAYDLARDGEIPDLKPRRVVLHEARVLDSSSPERLDCEIRCGKGYYIRALVRDMAVALTAEGHVVDLHRVRVGPFCEENAISLDALIDLVHKDAAQRALLPLETALDDIPALAIKGEEALSLRQGRPIVLLPHQVESLRSKMRPRTVSGEDASRAALALCGGKAVALGEMRAGRLTPTRIFYPNQEN
jgi:tRNA pseudouridine55 synthase